MSETRFTTSLPQLTLSLHQFIACVWLIDLFVTVGVVRITL